MSIIIFKFLKYLKDHPVFAVSLTYGIFVFLGVSSDWFYYSKFGINIFDFAEFNDFFFAPIKQFDVLIISLIAFVFYIPSAHLIIWLIFKFLNKYLPHPKNPNKFNKILSFMLGVIWMIFPGFLFGSSILNASIRSDLIKSGIGQVINIELKTFGRGSKNQSIDNVLIIGATDKYLFLYRKPLKSKSSPMLTDIYAIPLNNVFRVKFLPNSTVTFFKHSQK